MLWALAPPVDPDGFFKYLAPNIGRFNDIYKSLPNVTLVRLVRRVRAASSPRSWPCRARRAACGPPTACTSPRSATAASWRRPTTPSRRSTGDPTCAIDPTGRTFGLIARPASSHRAAEHRDRAPRARYSSLVAPLRVRATGPLRRPPLAPDDPKQVPVHSPSFADLGVPATPSSASPAGHHRALPHPGRRRCPTRSPAATSAAGPPPAPARPSPSASPSSAARRAGPSRAAPGRSCSCRPASWPPGRTRAAAPRRHPPAAASPPSTAASATARSARRCARASTSLVACPGRLDDLIDQRRRAPRRRRARRLDEADRMADMGFLPAVKRLLDQTPPDRQTLLFSATLDGDVDVLVKRYQHDPVRHEVEADVDARRATSPHLFWRLRRVRAHRPGRRRRSSRRGPTIVFCRTRHGADRVAKQLGAAGVNAAAIHGGRSQAQRDRALARLHQGPGPRRSSPPTSPPAASTSTTSPASCTSTRPTDAKDYVHRSGRTARAGAGVVVALVAPDQRKDATKLARQVGPRREPHRPRPRGSSRSTSPTSSVPRQPKPTRRAATAKSARRSSPSSDSRMLARPRRASNGAASEQIREPGPQARAASARRDAEVATGTVRVLSTRQGVRVRDRGRARTTSSCTPPRSAASTPPSSSRAGPGRYRVEQGRKGEQAAELHLASRGRTGSAPVRRRCLRSLLDPPIRSSKPGILAPETLRASEANGQAGQRQRESSMPTYWPPKAATRSSYCKGVSGPSSPSRACRPPRHRRRLHPDAEASSPRTRARRR